MALQVLSLGMCYILIILKVNIEVTEQQCIWHLVYLPLYKTLLGKFNLQSMSFPFGFVVCIFAYENKKDACYYVSEGKNKAM